VRLKFIDDATVVQAREILRQKHAYVIYDLHHRKNMETLRKFCEGKLGLILHGRFGEFAYINMDAVIERSMKRAREILS
jgi:UDP-galactopyranose mutase